MNINAGLYKRGPYWWYKVGGVRRSTKTADLADAIAIRDAARAIAHRKYVLAEWANHVAEHQADADSWLRRTHSRIKRKTALRNWPSCLTLRELTQLMLESRGACAVTGLPFARQVRPLTLRNPRAVSIDRIDSSKGYIPGNCRLVLLAVNLGMSQWGETHFREICYGVAAHELLRLGTNGGTAVSAATQQTDEKAANTE